ncbi:MAG TPA: transporter substrate-binding domain-containing protein [Anaerolineales bacterium]|nr:transporter substrate-binding domain-containing protein [Anaerolineales bacterium]
MKAKPVLFVFLLIAIVAGACAPAPTAAPLPPTPTVSADPVWDRVSAAGKIRFGSSLDYPPFDSYDQNNQPTGFDIALAREVGTRLGLQVEFVDLPFETLISTVQAGQVDSAIAAISVTPERQANVDFSNVYFSDKTSVLSRQGSGIRITAPDQLATYRIGVQRGTTYEQWVKQNLIDTGLMPGDKIFAYQEPEHAVNDLKAGYLDVVVMGALPADEFVSAGGVELSGESLNPQSLAIAMAKGSPTLLAKVNEALNLIQTDGTMGRLAEQYLGITAGTGPLPTVPPSNVTPQPVVVCDSMTFVADMTVPDGTFMNPGQTFDKVWRIKNTGTCTWDSSYKFVFVQGDSMGGQPQPINGSVARGQTYDMSIRMTAPNHPGSYAGLWQMVNGQNVPFGTRVWVEIVVPSSPGPQPTPAAPSIEYFTGPASVVAQGEVIILEWAFSTQDVVSAKLNRTNPDGTVTALFGGADVTSPGTYEDLAAVPGEFTYTLSVSTEFAGTDTESIQVFVSAP